MLKGKQKRFLRAMAVNIEPVCHIGKEGLGDNLIKQVNNALEAREIIKIKVLNNSENGAKEIAPKLALKVNSELVQVIGHNFVLFRIAKKKPKIQLPL